MENINGKVKTVAKKSIVEIKKAKLDGKPDSSINIRFLSTYFRGEVDILAGLCYNRYLRKATKYEKLNDKKRFRLISSRNPFFIAYSILQRVKAISVLLSSRNNLCKQKTRTRNNFPGACFSSVVELRGLEPLTYALRTHRSTNWAITPQVVWLLNCRGLRNRCYRLAIKPCGFKFSLVAVRK